MKKARSATRYWKPTKRNPAREPVGRMNRIDAKLLFFDENGELETQLLDGYRGGALVIGWDLAAEIARCASKISLTKLKESYRCALLPEPWLPDIEVMPLGTCAEAISYMKVMDKWPKCPYYKGRLLSLKNLSHALTAEHFTLEEALTRWSATDVPSLFRAMRKDYDKLPFADWEREGLNQGTPIFKLYTPASVAKGVFKSMGLTVPEVADDVQGIAMQAFYGPRAEVRLRKVKVHAHCVDFGSQYATAFVGLGLWPLLSARSVEAREFDAGPLMERIAGTPDLLFDRETWSSLRGYALVQPSGDYLPVRFPCHKKDEETMVRVTAVTSPEPLWYTLPDVAIAAAYAGRAPTILKAIRLEPVGKQQLRSVKIDGQKMKPDATLPERLVGMKEVLRRQQQPYQQIKTVINSGFYGILCEFNEQKNKFSNGNLRPVALCDGERQFTPEPPPKAYDKPGTYCCPILPSLVLAGGRLLLYMLERAVQDVGGQIVWLTTDAACFTGADYQPVIDRFTGIAMLRHDVSGWAYAIRSGCYAVRAQDIPPLGVRDMAHRTEADCFSQFFRESLYPEEFDETAYEAFRERYWWGQDAAEGWTKGEFVKVSKAGLGGFPNSERLAEILWSCAFDGTDPPAIWVQREYSVRKPATWKRQKGKPFSATIRQSREDLSWVYHKMITSIEGGMLDENGDPCRTWSKGTLTPQPIEITGRYLLSKESDRGSISRTGPDNEIDMARPHTIERERKRGRKRGGCPKGTKRPDVAERNRQRKILSQSEGEAGNIPSGGL